jgi:hypothetical protein
LKNPEKGKWTAGGVWAGKIGFEPKGEREEGIGMRDLILNFDLGFWSQIK